MEVVKNVIYQNFCTEKQKEDIISKINYSIFNEYVTNLYKKTYVQALLYGHMDENMALDLWSRLNQTLNSLPYPTSERIHQKTVLLPEIGGPYSIEKTINAHGNGVILTLEYLPFSFKTRAAQQILSQAMSEPFYSCLRTKQQTCYIISNTNEEIDKNLFNFFSVQSNTHSVYDILNRFELFIESFLQDILDPSFEETRFPIIKEALLSTLIQTPKSLIEMGTLLGTLAFKYEGDFDWISKRIEGFNDLTFEEFLQFSKQFLGKSNKRRFAVLIQGDLTQNQSFQYNSLKSISDLREKSEYIVN